METDTKTLFIEINETNFIFIAGTYDDSQNFKIIKKTIAPSRGIDKTKIINLNEVQEEIKKNIQIFEEKLNCIFKEVTIIIDNFKNTCISISGFKKLNGSQLLKENISYILNLLKITVAENQKEKTILHIFNSKSTLDGNLIENLPIGLYGDFYSHELTFFMIENNDLKNIKKLFNQNNLEVKKILIKNFVEGAQLINDNNNVQTFFKIKINKETSNISFFDKAAFRYEEQFNFGSNMIFKDIAKVCSIDNETIKSFLLDSSFKEKNFKKDTFLDEKFFSKSSYRKIRKKLIYDIANARIEEIVDFIIKKNVNIKSLIRKDCRIFIFINDELIFKNFGETFKYYCSNDSLVKSELLKDLDIDSLFMSAGNLSIFGWKKEAIPIPQTKNSLITRIFKYFFD